MKTKSILLLFSVSLLLLSCGKKTTTEKETDTISIPQEFECFNQPRVFIKYKQPVNGYTVKVMWLPYYDIGKAILHFENDSSNFFVYNHNFSDATLQKMFYDRLEAEKKKATATNAMFDDKHIWKNGEVLYLDYTPKENNEYLGYNSPFFFSDVNFDGEQELIINNWRSGSRSSNAYQVYKITHGTNYRVYGNEYYAELITEAPFAELEDRHVEFDAVNKTITTTFSGGAFDVEISTYQIKKYDVMGEDKPVTTHKSELTKVTVIDGSEYKNYIRKGDKLELVEQGKYTE